MNKEQIQEKINLKIKILEQERARIKRRNTELEAEAKSKSKIYLWLTFTTAIGAIATGFMGIIIVVPIILFILFIIFANAAISEDFDRLSFSKDKIASLKLLAEVEVTDDMLKFLNEIPEEEVGKSLEEYISYQNLGREQRVNVMVNKEGSLVIMRPNMGFEEARDSIRSMSDHELGYELFNKISRLEVIEEYRAELNKRHTQSQNARGLTNGLLLINLFS